MTRAPLYRALTPREAEIVELLAEGLSRQQIARHIGRQVRTVAQCCYMASMKVPGTLKGDDKLVAWARGASLDVLGATSVSTPSRVALFG